MDKIRNKAYIFLRWTEKYTKTDMVYLAKGGFWINLNFVFTSVISFIISIAFAKLLPKEVYGSYQFILSIGSMLGALTLTGMNSAVIRAVALGHEGVFKKSIPVQFFYNTFAFIVAIIVALYYAHQGNISISIGVIIVGTLTPILNVFNTYGAFIYGKKDFKTSFFYTTFLNIIYAVGLLTSLFLTKNALILIVVNLGINTFITFVLYIFTVKKYKPNDVDDPSNINYGKHLSLASIITSIAGQADNILVFHYLGTVELAIYAFASTIPEKLNGLLKSINTMAFPKLSERTNEELVNSAFSKSIKMGALTLCMAIIYIIFAPLIFKTFFPNYESSILYSQLYAVFLVVSALSTLPLAAITAMKMQKEIYLFNIASAIISISLMAIGAFYLGIVGIITGKIISSALNYFILMLFIIGQKKKLLQSL